MNYLHKETAGHIILFSVSVPKTSPASPSELFMHYFYGLVINL